MQHLCLSLSVSKSCNWNCLFNFRNTCTTSLPNNICATAMTNISASSLWHIKIYLFILNPAPSIKIPSSDWINKRLSIPCHMKIFQGTTNQKNSIFWYTKSWSYKIFIGKSIITRFFVKFVHHAGYFLKKHGKFRDPAWKTIRKTSRQFLKCSQHIHALSEKFQTVNGLSWKTRKQENKSFKQS